MMPNNQIRILSQTDIRQALPMREAVETMKQAFEELSAGRVCMPTRTHIDIPAHAGTALFMPSYSPCFGKIGVKVVNIFGDNSAKGLPVIQGLVCLLDGDTGQPLAVLNGTFLTALRTGAASGAATDLLARDTAAHVAVFGAGVQGRTQLEAVCAVRSIQKVWIVDSLEAAARTFAQDMGPALSVDVVVAGSSAEALEQADIVCTATVSSTPVFSDAEIGPGTHINAIGSYKPHVQEIPCETVLRSRVIVDHRVSALEETGDLIIPLKAGLMQESHIQAELGEVVTGGVSGRTSEDEVTLFKSVGVAIQDLAMGARVLERAQAMGLGTMTSL
jgi:ornithine cyclodeaminase/alanine dehydrogenase-like protein (mu-crystallin family)